jgi:hypothetical protein
MERYKHLSASIVLASPGILLVYDAIALYFGGRDATLSAVISGWALYYRELPWLVASVFLFLWLHWFGEIIFARH